MDVTKLLEADHRKVEDLFSQIEDAEGDDRQPLIEELATSLRGHMELEETTLYPRMEPVTGSEMVEEGNVEHELARKTLEDVLRLAPDEPGFGAALEALKAGIEHHVEEEEGEVFPKLRKERQLLEELAPEMVRKRAEIGMPMGADELEAASTKDDLLAEAKNVGIEGASSMSKHELAEALAASMS